MPEIDSVESNESSSIATPYEVADIALRLAASKSAGGEVDLSEAVELLERAHFTLKLAAKRCNPTALKSRPSSSLFSATLDADLLARLMDFPEASDIQEREPENYPLSLDDAAARVSGDRDKQRRQDFIRKAWRRKHGTFPSPKELTALLAEKLSQRSEFWAFALWLRQDCPRFKSHQEMSQGNKKVLAGARRAKDRKKANENGL